MKHHNVYTEKRYTTNIQYTDNSYKKSNLNYSKKKEYSIRERIINVLDKMINAINKILEEKYT